MLQIAQPFVVILMKELVSITDFKSDLWNKKSLLTDINFPTWLLIGCQQSEVMLENTHPMIVLSVRVVMPNL